MGRSSTGAASRAIFSRRAQNVVPRIEKKFVLYCLRATSVAFHCSAKKAQQCFSESRMPVRTNISKLSTASVRVTRWRQQVFGTLGRLDELKASGRLEALIRSGLESLRKVYPYRCACRRRDSSCRGTANRAGPGLCAALERVRYSGGHSITAPNSPLRF